MTTIRQCRANNLKVTDAYMAGGTQMIEAYRTGDTLDIPTLTTELAETTLFTPSMVSNIHSQLKTREEQEQYLDLHTAQ